MSSRDRFLRPKLNFIKMNFSCPLVKMMKAANCEGKEDGSRRPNFELISRQEMSELSGSRLLVVRARLSHSSE